MNAVLEDLDCDEIQSDTEDGGPPPCEGAPPCCCDGPRSVVFIEYAPQATVIFHPPGEYQYQPDANGEVKSVPYREIARQAAETAKPGAIFAFPLVYDEKGSSLWELKTHDLAHVSEEEMQKTQAKISKQLEGTGVTAVLLPVGCRVAAVATEEY
jgi:hypothetical protein